MILDSNEEEKIKKWLEKRVSSGLRCFVCGQQQWGIGNLAAMTSSIDLKTGRIHYMQGYPMIPLTCNNCAHTIFFSANMMGLSAQAPPPTP